MMRRVLLAGCVVLGLATTGQPSVWAQDPLHKGGRGVVNVLTCWIEIPKQIHLGSQENNPVTGLVGGAAKGVGLTVLRAGVGIYEAVTFPIPYPKDFASPYEEMELTDYAWE